MACGDDLVYDQATSECASRWNVYLCLLWKIVAEVMVNNQGLDVRIFYERWPGATTLVHHDNISRFQLLHFLSLSLIVHASALLHKMNQYRGWWQPQRSESPMDDCTTAEAICIFIRHYQNFPLRSSAFTLLSAGELQSLKINWTRSDPYQFRMNSLAPSMASCGAGHTTVPDSSFCVSVSQ